MIKLLSNRFFFMLVALLAQALIAFWGATSTLHPMGDVGFVYQNWVNGMAANTHWLGLNAPWVYPYPALAPMLIPSFLLPDHYLLGWLVMAISLNEFAIYWLIFRAKAPIQLGWYWLLATAALGPVALSRLDGLSVALGLFALASFLRGNPKTMGIWLTLATWIKVWPAALLASMLVQKTKRMTLVLATLATSLAVIFVGFALGANQNILSFVGAQNDRGIQLESIVAMPWVWDSVNKGGSEIYFDLQVLAYQVRGTGVSALAGVMNFYLLAALAATFALVYFASFRSPDSSQVLSLAAFSLTLELIVFNKVGSPQYLGWLILPALLAIALRVPKFKPALVGVLVTTALTQLVYPVLYDQVVAGEFWPVMALTARNLLEVLMLIWAICKLMKLAFKKQPKQIANDFVFN